MKMTKDTLDSTTGFATYDDTDPPTPSPLYGTSSFQWTRPPRSMLKGVLRKAAFIFFATIIPGGLIATLVYLRLKKRTSK